MTKRPAKRALSRGAGGRPPHYAGERLVKNRTFRIRDSLDQRLQEAAKQSGRTVSEEIQYRLEQSFDLADFRRIAEDAVVKIDEAVRNSASTSASIATQITAQFLKQRGE
jgi:predicted DNA-binding protein